MYAMQNKPKAEQTASPTKYPQGYFKAKPCKRCGTEFRPNAPSELYCSDECKDHMLTSKYLERTYGITYDDYLEMARKQSQRCAICGGEGFVMKACHKVKLVVDHCHLTGKVRGLLCHNCNRALGLLQDDKGSLSKAIAYLEGAETIRKE
ncbi:TPA: endonuclease VII domain-containing protein [Vibrio parahaemolyticus]